MARQWLLIRRRKARPWIVVCWFAPTPIIPNHRILLAFGVHFKNSLSRGSIVKEIDLRVQAALVELVGLAELPGAGVMGQNCFH